MKIALSGASGFVGWHTRAAARTRPDLEIIPIDRAALQNPELLAQVLSAADAVIHLAGVNRATTDSEVLETNTWLAHQLAAGLVRNQRPIPLVYGNSIHSVGETAFGFAKRESGEILEAACRKTGGAIIDVMLPNLFGEHGKPFYNSFVATFCHQLARGIEPTIDVDRDIPLLHVQRAASTLLDLASAAESARIEPGATVIAVSEALARIQEIAANYRVGDLPDLSDPMSRDLFNTYRSFTIPDLWPIFPKVNSDQRGQLFEAARARGGEAQVFVSTTLPGFTRGQHFHLHKVERFVVLRGNATIRLRKLFSNEVLDFQVSGDRPAIVDMPTMWVHSIVNSGSSELVTLFYADQVFDPHNPDTYAEDV